MFGPALIDAYEEAEAQDWLGFILHKTAEERMRHYGAVDTLCEYNYIRYPVPFKKRDSHSAKAPQPDERNKRLVYTIFPLQDAGNPPRLGLDDMQADADDQMVKAHDAMACPACENERARVCRKYGNLKEFIRDIVSQHSDTGRTQAKKTPETPAER